MAGILGIAIGAGYLLLGTFFASKFTDFSKENIYTEYSFFYLGWPVAVPVYLVRKCLKAVKRI